jgi:hypothetical protein
VPFGQTLAFHRCARAGPARQLGCRREIEIAGDEADLVDLPLEGEQAISSPIRMSTPFWRSASVKASGAPGAPEPARTDSGGRGADVNDA